MVYNNAIPQPTNNLSVSQGDILGNFGTGGIDSTTFGFSRDHTTMTDSTNGGTHKKCTFVEQGSGPTTIANQMALYCKDVSSVSQLFLRRESNGTEIQMSAGDPVATETGQSFLPGGVILKWGKTTNLTGSSQTQLTVNFATSFPSSMFMAVATSGGPGVFVYVQSPSSSSFVAKFSSAIANGNFFYWVAIGN